MKEFYEASPSDVSALRMENDLLMHEVVHLRGRLGAAERRLKGSASGGRATGEVASLKAQLRKARTANRESSRRAKRYREADRDVRMLVKRLNTSPLGPVLRRRAGFKALVEKYGGKSSVG